MTLLIWLNRFSIDCKSFDPVFVGDKLDDPIFVGDK